MKKRLAIFAVLFVTISLLALARAAAVAPAAKQFSTKFVLTAMKDGKPTVVAEPTLLTNEGQEGTFSAGGEVPVDADGKESLSFGISARIKVRQEAADKLRVSMYAGHGELDALQAPQGGKREANFIIREHGVRCVKTVKPGEKVEIDLGDGRTAAFSVSAVDAKP